jgi:hypothetical protein
VIEDLSITKQKILRYFQFNILKKDNNNNNNNNNKEKGLYSIKHVVNFGNIKYYFEKDL